MAKTLSNMIELGTLAPNFNLLNPVTNQYQSLEEYCSEEGTVIIFMCNHCPYVIHIIENLSQFIKENQTKGVKFVGINSNDIENYPDDSPENMIKFSKNNYFTFDYLYDETQEIAKSYGAACTPDIYYFDKDLKLIYRGQYDDSRPGNEILVTGKDLNQAIEEYITHGRVSMNQKPSMGCNIKWK